MKIPTVIKSSILAVCGGLLLTSLLLTGCASAAGNTEQQNYATTLGDFEPRLLDTMMVNTLEVNSKNLKSRAMKVIFFPSDNGVRLDLRYINNTVQLDLTEENRHVLVSAMESYIEQYRAALLTSANEKKKALFGKTPTACKWGLIGVSYSTVIPLRFEYILVEEKKPYFIMANTSTTEQSTSGKTINGGANSPALRIALSPIQCATLIDLISQENLVSLVEELSAEAGAFDFEDF